MNATRHHVILQSLTPIVHGDTLTGVDNATNTRLFMRQGAFVNGAPRRVPSLSENALRSVLFRVPLHDHLLRFLAIERGSLRQSVTNLLFSGGAMMSRAKSPGDEMALGHALKQLYPSLDLLGGAVDNFILPPSRLKLACWPVVKEYAWIIRQVSPDLEAEARGVSIFDCLFEETRTRGTGAESSGNQMLYTYETLAAGVKFLLEITLQAHTSPETEAAAWFGLSAWDGYLGGHGRQGRGRMGIVSPTERTADPYLTHVAQHAETLRTGLIDGTFSTGKALCTA